jgi:hypothetical protein
MKKNHSREKIRSPFEIFEEATHLLRTAPGITLATYYAGAVPFVVGFLYFWAEMSRSPFAGQDLAGAALVITILFFWMKFLQVMFLRQLRSLLAAEPMPRWTFREGLRVLFCQAVIQPTGLFILPLVLLAVLPFPWTYSFYQNATVLSDRESDQVIPLVRRAWKQSSYWAMQNHLMVLIAAAFALFVFLNWAILILTLPNLVKTLFGIETIFSRTPGAMVNTTTLTAVVGLTYLSVDPILKAAYTVRCFYGESLQSGEDLKAEIKRFEDLRRVSA